MLWVLCRCTLTKVIVNVSDDQRYMNLFWLSMRFFKTKMLVPPFDECLPTYLLMAPVSVYGIYVC